MEEPQQQQREEHCADGELEPHRRGGGRKEAFERAGNHQQRNDAGNEARSIRAGQAMESRRR